MNLCEGQICELKRGSARKMLKRNIPKKLWDHCLELESRIRSATTLSRYDLNHQTPGDENGNNILLFDGIVHHEKNDKAMTRA